MTDQKPKRVTPPPLHFGPYSPPVCRMGETVTCERLGDVVVVGMSAGPIQWPLGRKKGVRGGPSLILFGDLVRALRQEAGVSVCYWFKAGVSTVDSMRKALGVEGSTAGTTRMKQASCERPVMKAALAKAQSMADDPARREKIAASRRGVKRSAESVEKSRLGRLGTKLSEETRKRMSEAHKQAGTRPPWLNDSWTAEEDELALTLPIKVAAARTGRTESAVKNRQFILRRQQDLG